MLLYIHCRTQYMVKKIVILLSATLSIALGMTYFLGLAYFQTHFKPGMTINGYKCSFKSIDETEELLSKEVDGYAIAINTRNNGVEKIESKDIDMQFAGRSELIDLLNKQDYSLWFLPASDSYTLSSDCYKVDESKMKDTVYGLKCFSDIVEPEAAHIVEINDYYQVSSNVKGTEIDKEKSYNVIETAIKQWKSEVSLEDADCYIDVENINECALQEKCDILNSIQDTIITYDFGDRTETVNFRTIQKELIDEDYTLSIDRAKEYISKLSEKYDTIGTNRTFITYDNHEVSISGGDYGWKIDKEKTAEQLIELITSSTIDVVEPVYEQDAASRESNDIGYSYLEINTGEKFAVLYVDGEPVVQTKVSLNGRVSPGVYKVRSKKEYSEDMESLVSFGNSGIYKYTSDNTVSGTGDISLFTSNLIKEGHVAVSSQDMDSIYALMQEAFPIIVY